MPRFLSYTLILLAFLIGVITGISKVEEADLAWCNYIIQTQVLNAKR